MLACQANLSGSRQNCRQHHCALVWPGPFPVAGEQMRRGLAAHAYHQIHSVRGSRAEERCLRSCAVCARGLWSERMRQFRLFTEVAVEDAVSEAGAGSEQEECAEDEVDVSAVAAGGVTDALASDQIERVHEHILDVRRYAKLWPLIPAAELEASCTQHPSGRYEDGKPWLWLLNRKALPDTVTAETAAWVCDECHGSLTRKRPVMPKYALANSLWIGRVPADFRPGNVRLSAMTFTLLSLGRLVVQKIVAERHKPGRPEEKQKGMRANTVAFPQARVRELVTAHLPPTSEEATRYLSDVLSIALVGSDVEDGRVN